MGFVSGNTMQNLLGFLRQTPRFLPGIELAVLKNLYKSSPIGLNLLFSSCFIEAGFVPLRRVEPEPSSPQASLAKQETMAARPLKRIKSTGFHRHS